MTVFVVLVFSIIIAFAVAVLSYLVYDTVIMMAELEAFTPDEVFMQAFRQVKKERLCQMD